MRDAYQQFVYSGRWSWIVRCYTVAQYVHGEKTADIWVQIFVDLCRWLFHLRSGYLLDMVACAGEGYDGA